jgi:hypothetical protein
MVGTREGVVYTMTRRILVFSSFLLIFAACAAWSENIYIPVSCYDVFFVRGTVSSVSDQGSSDAHKEMIVTDADGKDHTIVLKTWTGYYPSDYRPYDGDEINVRCALVNKMTHLVIAEEIQFLKENFKPIE